MESALTAIETIGKAEGISEAEWLQLAAQNPAFLYLYEAAEDIYSTDDGVPFYDHQA